MEPFRILVDREVVSMGTLGLGFEFQKDAKRQITEILNQNVRINQTNQTVLNAIKIYTRSVFEAINEGDLSLIHFYDF